MLKKAVREAEQQEKAQVTSASMSPPPQVHRQHQSKNVVASIPEDPAAEAAEEAGEQGRSRGSRESRSPPAWEADFSLEDAPTPPSKDVLTTGMGRKNSDGGSSHPRG